MEYLYVIVAIKFRKTKNKNEKYVCYLTSCIPEGKTNNENNLTHLHSITECRRIITPLNRRGLDTIDKPSYISGFNGTHTCAFGQSLSKSALLVG